MKFTKRIISFILASAIVISLLPSAFAFSYTDMTEHLGIRGYEITTVAPGVSHIELSASNASGNQKIHAVEFDPKSTDTELRAGKSQGYVWSTQTVETIANNMTTKNTDGDVAAAAVNGDFFTFGVGVPHGIFIEDGEILSTPPQYYAAFGLTYDDEPFITRHGTILDIDFRINGILVKVAGINMAHASGSESVMLYTDEYARGTKTGSETFEVRARVNSGSVRHGETINITVTEINNAVGNTSLGDGYVVLSAQGAESIARLREMVEGESYDISFRFNEFWSNVKFAIGGIELLLKDGEIYSTSDSSNQPRTSIGIRADGTVVMATMDGRKAGGAVGMSYKTAAEAMLALGCVDALNLDGGGSTTFVLRKPGEMKAGVVNNISGGSQRQVANALVLMNTAPTLASPSSLTLSHKSRLVFAGGKYAYSVTGAYDTNYKPHNVPSDILWETDSDYNTISASGELFAEEAGKVILTARGGGAVGTAEAEIVDYADKITVNETKIEAKPGESFTLTATASVGGRNIEVADGLFVWEAPSSLGEFTSGKFTLSQRAVSGEITVSLGATSVKIPVTVKTTNKVISDFENDDVSFAAVGISTKTSPEVSLEAVRQYAHTGDRSLKFTYDFTGTTGSVGAYCTVKTESKYSRPFILDNPPKKLGMMVYGDGSGVELRSIIVDELGKQHTITYGKIDFDGWKYMEATLPEGLRGLTFVKVPVHIVSNPENPSAGTLYFDGLSALYNDGSIDATSPAIGKVYPADGEVITEVFPSIGIVMSDASGINRNSIELYIDGVPCENFDFDASSGKLSYTPDTALTSGAHSMIIFVRDKLGNPTFGEYVFEVKA